MCVCVLQYDCDSVGWLVNCSMVGSDTGDKMVWGTANSHYHQGEQQGNLGKANKNSMRLRCVLAYSFCSFQTVGGGDRRRRKTNSREGRDPEHKNTTLSSYILQLEKIKDQSEKLGDFSGKC